MPGVLIPGQRLELEADDCHVTRAKVQIKKTLVGHVKPLVVVEQLGSLKTRHLLLSGPRPKGRSYIFLYTIQSII